VQGQWVATYTKYGAAAHLVLLLDQGKRLLEHRESKSVLLLGGVDLVELGDKHGFENNRGTRYSGL
jgi:hypothetical protein